MQQSTIACARILSLRRHENHPEDDLQISPQTLDQSSNRLRSSCMVACVACPNAAPMTSYPLCKNPNPWSAENRFLILPPLSAGSSCTIDERCLQTFRYQLISM